MWPVGHFEVLGLSCFRGHFVLLDCGHCYCSGGRSKKKKYIYIYKDNVLYAMNTSLFLFCGSVHTRTLQDKKGMRLGPFAPLLKRCGRSEVGPAVHQNMFSSNNRGD